MSLKERKAFVIANSLIDIVQDIAPEKAELEKFFLGGVHRKFANALVE